MHLKRHMYTFMLLTMLLIVNSIYNIGQAQGDTWYKLFEDGNEVVYVDTKDFKSNIKELDKESVYTAMCHIKIATTKGEYAGYSLVQTGGVQLNGDDTKRIIIKDAVYYNNELKRSSNHYDAAWYVVKQGSRESYIALKVLEYDTRVNSKNQ